MTDKITCPNCGHKFDVEEALSGKLEEKYKAEYEKKINEQARHFHAERDALEKQKADFEKKKEQENELFQKRLQKKVEEEKIAIAKKTKENFEVQLRALQEENESKKEENKKLKEKELVLLKKEQQLQEEKEEMEINLQKQLLLEQSKIEEKAREKERETFALRELEYQKQIEDQKKLAAEMKRKMEQGSMQLQGEVQELALEELLSHTYPFDSIDEVPKGIRGADCIQTVINSLQQTCGSIVYESKRTKNFSNDWIDKLKQDQIKCKADIAVLVTQTMPSDMNGFGEIDGVWVCYFSEVKSLSFVLREMLINTQKVKQAEDNKGDRMELLYNYLTSNEFVQNVKRIVENYDSMTEQLNREKKAMHKIWSQREKQIWVVQENIAALFGSIKGIAGHTLDTVSVLELPDQSDGTDELDAIE